MENKRGILAKIGFRYAGRGIIQAISQEHNLKIHLGIAVLVVVSGFVFAVSITEWLFLTGAIMAVLVTELINTAIETLCDMVSTKDDPNIGFIKDVSAGAVLVASVFAAIIGLIIFVPKLGLY